VCRLSRRIKKSCGKEAQQSTADQLSEGKLRPLSVMIPALLFFLIFKYVPLAGAAWLSKSTIFRWASLARPGWLFGFRTAV
jgi:ABC-type polysaccharide transport system permease subunit